MSCTKQTYKNCQSPPTYTVPWHQHSFILKILYWGQNVPLVLGGGYTKSQHRVVKTPAQIYNDPLPCLLGPLCTFLCFSFATLTLFPFADMCLVLHHYTEWRGSYNSWANQTLVDVQICLHCCCNSSQVLSFKICHKTHTHTKIQTACTESKKRADQSIATCSERLLVQSSVWLQFSRTWNILCASGGEEKRSPRRSPALGIYASKNSPILHSTQKQFTPAATQNSLTEHRQKVKTKRTYIYMLNPTFSLTERSQACHIGSNGGGTHGSRVLVKLAAVK